MAAMSTHASNLEIVTNVDRLVSPSSDLPASVGQRLPLQSRPVKHRTPP